MTDIREVEKAVLLLSHNIDCFVWRDFSDIGNPCYSPYIFDTTDEMKEEAYTFAAVRIAMPKGSEIHQTLSGKVADSLDVQWVTYDWLIKGVSRIVAISSLQEFTNMINLSVLVKNGMVQRGLTKINNISEAFA